jgi:hypothetical protein
MRFFAFLALASLAFANIDIFERKCGMKGSGTIVCRSCASQKCENMGTMNMDDTYNFNCACPNGQEVGGSS